ncbi:hypothetical protein GCM10011289_16950 [Paludibacterium paludis]|uniref:Uncharacterized protein n=1 Tax=Paludibacterium paludis TaxID=1225769 RepID=A0A918U948_9NEIS|nr:hypothetical protein GCM10011289_16950 [Paludibacterium paludis]
MALLQGTQSGKTENGIIQYMDAGHRLSQARADIHAADGRFLKVGAKEGTVHYGLSTIRK